VASLAKRERVLLAYLALSPKGREQRRKLTTLLWGDSADETTLENLRNCLYGLRKTLGDSDHRVIASDGEDIVLDAAAFEVDALAFRRLAAQPDRADLEVAAKLYAGGLLDGLDIESEEFESWRRSEATRCRDQAVDVLHRLMTQLSDAVETERAIETGERILRLDPLHESAVRRLMRLHAGSGRRSAAIQLYRTLSDALKTELDAQPEAETRAVFAEITRGGDEQTGAPAADTKLASASANMARHPGYEELSRRTDARLMDGPLKQGHDKGGTRFSTRNWILAGGLAAAIALVLAYQFIPWTGTTTAQQVQAGEISVVVLPFTNLSGDPGQDFFSDGMTEEITAALARVPSLRVIGRTSAFQFKGQRKDFAAIRQALDVPYLVDGSVRMEGDRIRITAQLIQADNGVSVWTQSYDRQIDGVFATQEDIAQAIAVALSAPLGLAAGETLVSNRNIDPEDYQQFLRAKALLLSAFRGMQAIEILEPLLARKPDYAPAWALLALAHHRVPFVTLPNPEEWMRKAEAAAERAIQLDANLPDGYSSLGATMVTLRNLLRADEVLSKARALDPFHPDALNFSAHLLGVTGRVKEALAIREQLARMEPFVPAVNPRFSVLQWINGRSDEAVAMLKVQGNVAPALADLAQIYSAAGRYSDAADALMAIPPGGAFFPAEMVEAAVRLLRTAPAAAAPQSLPELNERLSFVYFHVGLPERVLQPFEESLEAGILPNPWIPALWHPLYAPVRKTERFKAFARNAGLVEYWRAKGWPEFCRAAGADDFVCM